MSRPLDLRLYLVTDTAMCGPAGVPETVRAAVEGGVTAVQLRDPAATEAELVTLGRAVVAALAGTGVPLLVNDRVDLVEAIGAQGAHVGQGDLDVAAARRLLGPAALLGLSVQTPEHVWHAEAADAELDYLGVGPVWPQSTKSDAAPPAGLDTLSAVVSASPWPCVAIGGVTVDRVPEVRERGAAGVAVVSAVCGQPDPATAASVLRRAWDES
ncbi:thiamine phosphate synthase [Dermatophilaceae bacterium Soc4.6]